MLQQRINDEIKAAMKGGDHFTLDVLRFLNAALTNKSIEKRGRGLAEGLTEEEVLEILSREVKKRREAAELYKKGNRSDLAEKEEKEIIVIQKYLPAQMSREEVEKKVVEILSKTEAKDLGSAMKEVMKELRGKADSRLISEIVKERLK
jgi:uncharacterized protein YqeY